MESPAQNRQQGAVVKDQEESVASVSMATLRYTAMSLLARREHSRLELKQKLVKRYPESDLVDTVVQNLADEALQSDDRFAEAFVSMRKNRGQGPVRIVGELKQRGVTEAVYGRYIDPLDEEWLTCVRSVCLRKYGSLASKSAQRAKQMRFLQYRGFTAEQIRSLWRDES